MIAVKIRPDTKDNYYELNAIRIIKEHKNSVSLSSFESNFKSELINVPKKTTLTADLCFRVKWVGDQYMDKDAFIEIWHVDISGIPDRLIATVKNQ